MTWQRRKPTQPGEYLTRTDDKAPIYSVVVTKRGRGLSVYCAQFDDRVPMSELRDDELEWKPS